MSTTPFSRPARPYDDLDDDLPLPGSVPAESTDRVVVCGGAPVVCGPRRDRDLEDDLTEAFEAFRRR